MSEPPESNGNGQASPSQRIGPVVAVEVALLHRALRGDRTARRRLVARLMPVVQARVRRIAARNRGEPSADDLVQDVWLALFADGGKKLLAYQPAKGATLEGFVGIIADREALRVIRANRAKKRGGHLKAMAPIEDGSGPNVPAAHPDQSPEGLATAADLVARLGDHLAASLSERGMLVFRYVFTDGLEPYEAAELLRVNVQVIYNWQFKIRNLVREFLEQAND